VWTENDHNNTGIWGERYDALGARVGGLFGTVLTDYRSPAITGLPDGGFAVAFSNFAPSDNIYVQRVTASASVRDTIDASAAVTRDPALTSFSDGSYVVAYTVGSGADTDIAARVVSATGVVGAQFFIHNETDNSAAPQVATLSDGNFVAVYQDEDNGGATNIEFRILQPNTTAVTAPTAVSGGDGPENEINPDVAALRDGGFVVVWADDFGSYQYDATASIYDNTGGAVRLNIPIFSMSGFAPDVLALADGGFLVTSGGHGQRFDADGDRVGLEFTPSGADAALLTSGRFAYATTQPFGFTHQAVATSIWDFGPLPAMDLIGDLFWRHVLDGDVATTENALGVVPLNWQIVGSGDFDGDRDADILWRHDGGLPVIWEMQDGAFVTNHNLPDVPNSYQVAGTGDFDGDGDADILWRHDGGLPVIWEMQDGTYVTNHNLPDVPNSYQVAGTGDFDGDGDADILWRHDGGLPVIWEMEDAAFVVNHNLPWAETAWHVTAAADFDDDGDADILWRHSGGNIVSWEMQDSAFVVDHNLGIVPAGWQISTI
jgi:hypothetical protein